MPRAHLEMSNEPWKLRLSDNAQIAVSETLHQCSEFWLRLGNDIICPSVVAFRVEVTLNANVAYI